MATILVVDDERMVCDLLRAVVSRYGHEVLTATSGREGVALFEQQRPRITLLDLHLPGMNGIDVLKRIRAINPQAAVIVLTGRSTDELENQARELGVTDFLRKSLSLDILVRSLERSMQQPVPTGVGSLRSSESVETPSVPQESETILIVDDEPQVRDMISQFLTRRGYRVRVAPDGPTALALVAQECPHLIMTDMYMPGMTGLDLVRELRAKQYTGGILMLTAGHDEKALQEVLDLGATDVISKPVDLERLILAIGVALVLTDNVLPPGLNGA